MTDHTIDPVRPSELAGAEIPAQDRVLLANLLNNVLAGGQSTVSLDYRKQTQSRERTSEAGDYVALPGVDSTAQIGDVVRVFRRKADNALRFTIASITRSDGEKPGYTAVIPEGIKAFAVVRYAPPAPEGEGA